MTKYLFQGESFDTYAEALAARGEALSEVEPGQYFGEAAFEITEKEVEEE